MSYEIKNVYTIFFASSITELEIERLRLTNFVNKLSGDYLEQFFEIRLKPVICEDEDPCMAHAGKQTEYDDAIRESRMCFFVFHKKVGKYTEHELEVAKAAFDKTELPKIYFFFKKPHGEEFSEEVAALQAKLDKDFGHYYTFFEDIDTVHLRIVLQIMRQVLPEVSIELKDGKVLANGEEIKGVDPMSLPEFRNNKDLAHMREEYAALDAECKKLYKKLKKSDCPADIIAEYSQKRGKRSRLREEIEQLLGSIFNISKEICSESGVVDAKRRAAYRYLEEGNSKKALEMLDEGELAAESDRVLRRASEVHAEAKGLIDTWKLRIDILLTMTEDEERFAKVRAAYETIEKLVDECHVGVDRIWNYAWFLRGQNEHERAYDKALKYVYFLETDKHSGKNVTDGTLRTAYNLVGIAAQRLHKYVEAKEYLGKAYDLAQHLSQWTKWQATRNLGILCKDTSDFGRALEYYREALTIVEELYKVKPSTYASNLAWSYTSLGSLCMAVNKYAEAREWFEKAFKITGTLYFENPSDHASDMATAYHNVGNVHYRLNEYDAAQECYKKALEIREQLYDENPSAYAPNIANIYISLGNLHCSLKEYDKAQECYKKALEIREQLYDENPSAYAPNLANIYISLGNLHYSLKEYDKAREYYDKALGIREKLNAENLSVYAPDLAMICNNLGALHQDLKEYDKAREYYEKALEIREKLKAENPSAYAPDLAMTYNNLGILYSDLNDYGKAREYYEKALEIREKLKAENPSAYAPDLAATYNSLGILYYDLKEYGKAREYYEKALKIREKLKAENSSAYAPDLATSYNNLGILYSDLNDYGKAREYYEKALEIREKLKAENSSAYAPDLAGTYNNLGSLHKDLKEYDKAREYYEKALEIREKLNAENPSAYAPGLAMTYSNLGILHKDLKEYGKAREWFEKELECYAQMYAGDPVRYAHDYYMCMIMLWRICKKCGDRVAAKKYYEAMTQILFESGVPASAVAFGVSRKGKKK